MKHLFLLLLVFGMTAASSTLEAQTLKVQLEEKMEKMMRDDSRTWNASTYINNSIKITGAREEGDVITVSGSFKARVPLLALRPIRTIAFKATITSLLGDYSINRIWWTQPVLNTVYSIDN